MYYMIDIARAMLLFLFFSFVLEVLCYNIGLKYSLCFYLYVLLGLS